jgi:hypothetical protein
MVFVPLGHLIFNNGDDFAPPPLMYFSLLIITYPKIHHHKQGLGTSEYQLIEYNSYLF